MENQRILKAAITSANTLRVANAGGLLGPEQADKFIDYLVDSSVLLKRATVYRLTGDSRQLDTIGVNGRVIRKGTEGTDPGFTVGVGTGRRELTTEEVILPFDITFNFLDDNIEKEGAEDHVARLMAQQFANDTEDLGVNGDSASGDAFIQIKNGWVKILNGDAAVHKYDHNGSTDYKGVVLRGMLAQLSEKWKRNTAGLAYLVAPSVEEEYRLSLADRATALGDRQLTGGDPTTYAGIPILPVPFLAADTHLLTNPKNLAYGIKRAIRVGRQVQERKRLIEYTITARVGFEWLNPDAAVISQNYA